MRVRAAREGFHIIIYTFQVCLLYNYHGSWDKVWCQTDGQQVLHFGYRTLKTSDQLKEEKKFILFVDSISNSYNTKSSVQL